MAKFIIQDIVPPRRKKSVVATHKHSDAHDQRTHVTNARPQHREPIAQSVAREPEKPLYVENKLLIKDEIREPETQEVPVETPPSYVAPKLETPISQRVFEAAQEHSFVPPGFISGQRGGYESYKGWIKWIVATVIVSVIVLVVVQYFASATVTLTPKYEVLSVDTQLNATRTATGTDLTFGVAKISLDDSVTVPASGTRSVTEKASGQIIVYNEQLTAQRLIKNTRFQSPKGLIYRINESIVVPKAVSSGGKLTPGTLTVTVYADEAGPNYNSEPTDFTIPGLKGGAAYSKVYARSKGSITGGASGVIKVVSDADLKSATEKLRVSLETKLRNKARSELLPSQIVYDNGIIVSLEKPALSNKDSEGPDTAVLAQKGTIYLVVFDRDLLTLALAEKTIENWSGEQVTIKNLEKLLIQFSQLSEKSVVSDGAIAFAMTGNAEFVWSIDTDVIKKALSGTRKSDFFEIMKGYKMVASAKANFSPKWQTTFPDDVEQVEIILLNTDIAK